MNNYLSHRWPQVAAAPATVPEARPPKKKKGRKLRTVLIILACVLVVAALTAGAYFGIIFAAERFAHQLPGGDPYPSDATPTPSAPPVQAWSPDDSLWGTPDPSTTVSLSQPKQQTLSPQNIYHQVLPSVVCIQAEHADGYSVGSGIVLSRSGYIVTNYHVIEDGFSFSVMLLPSETTYDAKLIGYDRELDIAVLHCDAPNLSPASFADSDLLHVGDAVYAIGNPMGYLYGTMTDGIVSSLARQVTIEDRNMTLIQTSVPLNSGNSGGALVDSHGQVVGIAVAKLTGLRGDTVVEAIGLAIPITDALPFINHIIHTGASCRPSLGILCYETQVDGQRGILVDDITPNTPAQGRLLPGDLIIVANGTRVEQFHTLSRILFATGVGNEVELTVRRSGVDLTVSVPLYDRLTEAE